MGSKFCNLNLRGTIEQAALDAVLPGAKKFPWENGWTTLTWERLQWGSTQDQAKKLSMATGSPVLSTEYFDDDYVEFAVYREGKRAARHVPVTYEDLRKSRGRPEKFLEALGLNLADAPRLKKIFQAEDCEEATVLLESFLGCPMFGVDEDTPPTEIPDPELARTFAGEESPVKVTVTKRSGKKDAPPYARTLEKAPGHAGIFETVFCYTDHPEKIENRIKALLRMWEQRLESDRSLDVKQIVEEARRIRVIPGERLTRVEGFPIVNVDVDLPDLSWEFKCLVAVCRVIVKGENQVRVTIQGEELTIPLDMRRTAELHCGLAYGKKLLCFGRRGAAPDSNDVMPEIELESPWLTLRAGELVEAFERPNFWDAVKEVGELLGYPIHPDMIKTNKEEDV